MSSPPPPVSDPDFDINIAMNTFSKQLGERVRSGQMTVADAQRAQAQMRALQVNPAMANRAAATEIAQRALQVGPYHPSNIAAQQAAQQPATSAVSNYIANMNAPSTAAPTPQPVAGANLQLQPDGSWRNMTPEEVDAFRQRLASQMTPGVAPQPAAPAPMPQPVAMPLTLNNVPMRNVANPQSHISDFIANMNALAAEQKPDIVQMLGKYNLGAAPGTLGGTLGGIGLQSVDAPAPTTPPAALPPANPVNTDDFIPRNVRPPMTVMDTFNRLSKMNMGQAPVGMPQPGPQPGPQPMPQGEPIQTQPLPMLQPTPVQPVQPMPYGGAQGMYRGGFAVR